MFVRLLPSNDFQFSKQILILVSKMNHELYRLKGSWAVRRSLGICLPFDLAATIGFWIYLGRRNESQFFIDVIHLHFSNFLQQFTFPSFIHTISTHVVDVAILSLLRIILVFCTYVLAKKKSRIPLLVTSIEFSNKSRSFVALYLQYLSLNLFIYLLFWFEYCY